MTRKVDGTERSGRFTAPSAAGGFGGSDTALTRLARPFTPKPFRSTGGMSTSADTMMSLAMGRHNTDDEMPDDQVNIGSIVSRKTSDRRYLPRKLGNMKKYLHTTPISEALNLSVSEVAQKCERFEILLRESSIQELNEDFLDTASGIITKGADFLSRHFASKEPGSVGGISPELYAGMSTIAPFVPVLGDVFYGYAAYHSIEDIMDQSKKIEEFLSSIGVDVSLTDDPKENIEKISKLKIARASDRAFLKETILKIGIRCFEALTQIVAALPLDLVPGLQTVDFIADLGLTGSAFLAPSLDPEGEKITDALINFSHNYEDIIKTIGTIIPGLNDVVNFMGNLGEIRKAISSGEIEVSQSSTDPDVLAELRRKRKKRTNEFSTTAGVAGYTGPMKGPTNPKQFYSTMARAAGSEYLVDPVKTSKPKP